MKSITVLGTFVADLVFFGDTIPLIGETVLGKKYVIGPGGKGSNQAVAAAKAGIKTKSKAGTKGKAKSEAEVEAESSEPNS